MSGNENNDLELFQRWQQESGDNSQQLNFTEMEKLLKKASTDFSVSLQRTIKADMVFKILLMTGFLIISVLNPGNPFVISTSLVFLLFGMFAVITENNLIRGIRNMQSMEKDIMELVRNELKFYRGNQIRYPVMIAFSFAMFYVLGSMIYHAMTYGYIQPFDDAIDVAVLLGLMLLGILISLGANFPYFKAKINNLEMLMDDLENEENFLRKECEIRTGEKLLKTILLIIAVIGIVALMLMVLL